MGSTGPFESVGRRIDQLGRTRPVRWALLTVGWLVTLGFLAVATWILWSMLTLVAFMALDALGVLGVPDESGLLLAATVVWAVWAVGVAAFFLHVWLVDVRHDRRQAKADATR